MERRLVPAEKVFKRRIHQQPLDDVKVCAVLSSLRQLLQSAYGPYGRLKFLQTASGGHVTTTSSSSVILHHLMSNCHTIVRLILMSVKGHLDVYHDGGIITSLLTIRLIESSLELSIPRQIAIEVNTYALHVISDYLSSEDCPWRMKLDVGDMKSVLCLLRSVINTKPACGLSAQELEHICTILLKAFLYSIPSSAAKSALSTPVQFLRCEGSPVCDTRTVQGVILEAPNLPTHFSENLLPNGTLKVALYNVSMATDTEEWFDGVENVVDGAAMYNGLREGVLEQMIDAAKEIVSAGVGLIGCQKCIHPTLKRFLKQQGVFVIERLSAFHIDAVQSLTGCNPLSTFATVIPETCYGYIQGIKHTVIANKSYLHLLPLKESQTTVSTIILCSPDESALNELYTVCQSAMSVLCRVLASPYVVPGGGCLDTHLSWLLYCQANKTSQACLEDIGCTKYQFTSVIKNIIQCLEGLASDLEHDQGGHFLDTSNHHHWSVSPETDPEHCPVMSCMCGMITRDGKPQEWCAMGDQGGPSPNFSHNHHWVYPPGNTESFESGCQSTRNPNQEIKFVDSIIDLLAMRMNSFRIAFETANAILRVNCLVTDE